MNMLDNVSISSAPKGSRKKDKGAGPTSMRLYRAPQSSIRGVADSSSSSLVDEQQYRDKSNAARRRRQQVSTIGNSAAVSTISNSLKSPSMRSLASPKPTSNHGAKRSKALSRRARPDYAYSSDEEDSSCHSVLESIGAPCLWSDDVEAGHFSTPILNSSWSPSQSSKGQRPSRYRAKRHSLAAGSNGADSVVSEQFNDDESVCTHYTTRSILEVSNNYVNVGPNSMVERDDALDKGSRLALYQRRFLRLWQSRQPLFASAVFYRRTRFVTCLQLLVVLAFVLIVCDSRRRVHRHHVQLAQYDEERAHILEQMTWIDTAAKKIHRKYAGYDQLLLDQITGTLTPQVVTDPKNEWRQVSENLQEQLDLLQLRVQQNARDRTVRQFGDKPVQVSLPVDSDEDATGQQHIVIALSDDAPHAVSTFLQQVSIGLWDTVDFTQFQNGRVLQAATRYSNTAPVLEFVEKSRGCRHAGSVALRQLESDSFHVLVLKVNMEETATIDDGDVCIGTVVKGLETLEQIIPLIPIIHTEGGGSDSFDEEEANGSYRNKD